MHCKMAEQLQLYRPDQALPEARERITQRDGKVGLAGAAGSSFNGKFRYECLNEHWFLSMHHSRRCVTGVEAMPVFHQVSEPS